LALWEQSGASAEEIIHAAEATEWREPLLRGWTHAAARQRSSHWAEPLLRRLLQSDDDAEDARALFAALEPASRERVLTDAFRDASVSYARGLRMLESCTHAWSERFSRAVLAALKSYFGQPDAYSEHALRNTVKQHVTRRLSPSLAAEAEKGWSQSSAHWHKGDEDMASALAATLAFRHAMLEELKR
jgi:hypothetical protein